MKAYSKMMEQSGGRAGPDEFDWVNVGYELDQIEPLRQQLLSQNDVGQVQKAMRKLGIRLGRELIQAVKNYNFDSQGLAFLYLNYAAWRRLATGQGTISDASYLIHEIAEVEALQKIKQKVHFDFMGPKNIDNLSRVKRQQWKADFRRYYLIAHSKALEAEYEFIAEQIEKITNGAVKISKLQAAAIDPTRRIRDGTGDSEAWRYMIVDGVPMKLHHHFDGWRQRTNELIPLSKSMQRRLRYYLSQTTLDYVIQLVKNVPIN